MGKIDKELFNSLLPSAIEWAEKREAEIIQNGQPLSDSQLELARLVGVAEPQSIRILEVQRIPEPDNIELRRAGEELGFFGWSPIGRAIGYGVEILHNQNLDNHPPDSLYRHEFRHVHQFEKAGSVEQFITEYLLAAFEYGYENSPFEKDARAYETGSVQKRGN